MSTQNKNPPRHGPMSMMGGVKAKNFKKGLKRFIKYLSPFYIMLCISIILAVLGTVCSIVGPKLLGKMTDLVYLPTIDFDKVTFYGLWLIGLYAISATFEYVQGFFMGIISAKIGQKMRFEIAQKINKLPLKYFDKNSYGDTLSRVTNDVDTITQTLNQSLSQIITSITMVLGILIMMLSISWQLTIAAVAFIPIGLLLVLLIVKKTQKYYRQQQKMLGALNGQIEEVFSNHNIVKAFNGTEEEKQKFDETNQKLFESGYKNQFFGSIMMPIMGFIGNFGFVAVTICGGILALDGIVTVGAILSFLIYVRQFTRPLQSIASISSILQSTVAASERVFEFLDEEEIEKDKQETKTLTKVFGNVEFKNVKFGYDKQKPIIKNFSIKVEAGQKVAIVGPTGAGKTTLINLLERFYELDDGDILIDGVSIKDMKKSDVRSLFGMVLQDTWLFEGTIRDNLKFGNNNATDKELLNALKDANILHFVSTLDGGLDHVLSEESAISQGQKQLLTIARAMVQNAPILILDEATSFVDTRTEIEIQKAMDSLSQNKTSFVIAHRLSTIKNADIILVIKDGDIVEKGTHESLLNKNGEYAKLYNSQFLNEED